MKPKKLILSGWGPYRDRIEVDFTKLEERGLFLITGATGAGKTTLFDAITYALYGLMSGDVREKNSVRSDFADMDTATFVDFSMLHGGKEYRIVRNPEYLRPKKRAGGKKEYTKEKESAVLYLADGIVVQGVSEVNRRMQEVLVLDYRQFKQISMIAQGEFARLLAASPAEKTRIFRSIFSTAVYDIFAVTLRSRANELYKRVMEYKHRMTEDIHLLREEAEDNAALLELISAENYSFEKVLLCLTEMQAEEKKFLDSGEREYQVLEKEITALVEEITECEEMNKKLCQLKETHRKLESLKEQEQEIRKKEEIRRQAQAAANLNGDFVLCEKEQALYVSLFEKKEKIKAELQRIEEKKKRLFFLYENREVLQRAYECREQYYVRKKSFLELQQQTIEKNNELCKLQNIYLKQEAITEEKKTAFEEADKLYKRAAVGIAARLLREGEPCPVCGSLEHPQKAVVTAEVPDEEGLQRLKTAYHAENDKLLRLHGETAVLQGELQGRKEQETEAKLLIEEDRSQLAAFSEEIRGWIEKNEKRFFEAELEEYQRLQVQEKERREQWFGAAEEVTQQKKCMEETLFRFEQKCMEAGFSSAEVFQQSIKSQQELETLENDINQYQSEIQAQESLRVHLQSETLGREMADTKELRLHLEEKKEKRQEVLSRQSVWNHRLQEVRKVQRSLQEKLSKQQALSKEYGIVKDLDNLASGNNTRRLVFEQYVLSGYFEQILRAANIRLAKMTDGRYELSRVEEVGDGRTKDSLEMQIMDYYTGKLRSVKTLSGGESFKTSLSLALGMSDVIQSYSGGIRVETLFIDEGFGALDGESLEQACQTLISLAKRDKLIGIISHVPELSEKIGNQIVITKTKVGSSVEVVVS